MAEIKDINVGVFTLATLGQPEYHAARYFRCRHLATPLPGQFLHTVQGTVTLKCTTQAPQAQQVNFIGYSLGRDKQVGILSVLLPKPGIKCTGT